jgi:type IV pilus assembly protein PilY1
VCGTASADDTDLYVSAGNDSSQNRPQVLIIFDNSGSMATEEAVAVEPFDPAFDYTGNGANRIFYVRGTVAIDNYPDPRDASEWRFFDAGNNACAQSVIPHPADPTFSLLGYEGRFTSNLRFFKRSKGTWDKLPERERKVEELRDSVVDCKADLEAVDPNNAPMASTIIFRQSGFPQNQEKDAPFDEISAGADQSALEAAAEVALNSRIFRQNDSATLLTENYLTYLHHYRNETRRQRIDIARDTIISLINATPGVDFGLEVFNFNSSQGNDDHGGRIIAGVREMTAANRATLVTTINGLAATTWTPLCESLFEAYRYYSDGQILGGFNGDSLLPSADTSIINNNRYQSPMRSCQKQAHIILITDGEPYRDHDYDALLRSELGLNTSDRFDDSYLSGVAAWMQNNDVNPNLLGQQHIVTYTIGFSQGADGAAELLTETAKRGGGQYYAASDALALQGSLQQIFSEILAINATFTAPAIAANSYDRTQTLDAIYYAMFLPSDRPRWTGNLKKLRINGDGRVMDQIDRSAINREGAIADTACTIWTSLNTCTRASSGGDGNEVLLGGALEATVAATDRRILTSPQSTAGALVTLNQNTLINAVGDESTLLGLIGAPEGEGITDYIDWLRGFDVDDDDENGDTTSTRDDVIGDPLHSKPLALSYGEGGGTRVLMGTNHGYLHMFHDLGESVTESWAYYLPEMLPTLRELRLNAQTGGHTVYGVDGAVSAWVMDADADGNIERPDDKVWAFFGLRRGGRAYFALDISDPDAPKKMWSVSHTDPGMSELGQSWSEPVVTRVPGIEAPVIIIAGGYDSNKDNAGIGTPDSMGRAVFILDAESGDIVHRFTATESTTIGITRFPATDSLATKVSIMDTDGDSVTDRFYAVDTGGNVWRFDLPDDDSSHWSVFRFAELGGDTLSDDRRFFGEVSVAPSSFERVEAITVEQNGEDQVITTSSETPFDAVLVGSGNRASPNDGVTQDYLFLLRDIHIRTQYYGAAGVTPPPPIRLTDLFDATGALPDEIEKADSRLASQLTLSAAKGWYLPLRATEKALAAPTLISGVAYFTTFLPGELATTDTCVAAGQGFLYAFTLQDGRLLKRTIIGAVLPDTPQIVVPPPADGAEDDWNPKLYLVGVGAGEDNKGTIDTRQSLTPKRIYYQYGERQ